MKTNREMLKTVCFGIVTIFIFYSSYWLKGNIGRVDKIAAAKSKYTQSLVCIEDRYYWNKEYIEEADSLEKKIESGTYNGDIKEAKSLIVKNRERSVEGILKSKDCIDEAEKYEKKNNIDVPADKIKIREKIKNTK